MSARLSDLLKSDLATEPRLERMQTFGKATLEADLIGKQARILSDESLMYEQRLLPVAAAPYLISRDLDATVRQKFEAMHRILEKVVVLYQNVSEVRDFFDLDPRFDALARLAPSGKPAVHFCRFDFAFDGGVPKIYEINSDCPGGYFFTRQIVQFYREAGLLRRFSEVLGGEAALFPFQKNDLFARSLIDAYREGESGIRPPVIAILKSRHKTMTNELTLILEEAQRYSPEAFIAFVEDLRSDDGGLYHEDKKIDIVYSKFDSPDADFETAFTKTAAEGEAFLNGVRRQQALFVNSMPSKFLIEHKSVLAFLREPRFQRFFDESQRRLIAEVVPETHLLKKADARTIAKIIADKDSYVLKKSMDTRGRSVVLGREVRPAAWEDMVRRAAAEKDDAFVAQRCHMPEECIDQFSGQKFYTTQAYFLLRGKAVGMLPRISARTVTNVGQGGLLQIALLVD